MHSENIERVFIETLRDKGLKATPGRVAILKSLKHASRPISIASIMNMLQKNLNQVTVYRALQTMANSGIVQRVDLRHQHAHYEIIEKEEHHHHLVCKTCGKIENIPQCKSKYLENTALAHARGFKEITSHSLEFFGQCKSCTRKNKKI